MNAERLLQHFDRISEAPDAIPHLRRFILDLAVRGKLVEQDPNDEPASELLKRLQTEKARLIKEGKLRRSVGSEEAERRDFLVPHGWVLTTLGELALKITDGAHKTPTYLGDGVPFISVKDFSGGKLDFSNTRFISPEEHRVLYQRCDPRRGDILIGRIGTLGKAVLVDTDVEFSLFVSVGLIRFSDNYTAPIFLLLLLNSPFVEAEFDRIKVGGGTHTNKLNLGDLHTVVLPLPPLAEQNRVVAKVDELMALCDQLQAAKTERERSRDRLVAASLHHLNPPADAEEANAPEAFRDHARFIFNHLQRLISRTEHIKQLRQTILNLAVRGKLVPQDPNDEPASELLKRIQAEKARLIRDKKLKRQNGVSPIQGDEIPFDAPAGWTWVKADDLSLNITDGFHNTPSPISHGYPYITAKHVKPEGIDFGSCMYVDEKNHKDLFAKTRVKWGDILIVNIGAGCGTPALVDVDFEFSFKNVAIINIPSDLDRNYLFQFLMSYRVLVFEELIKGGAQPFLGLGMLREMLIPLPPFTEQHRIVAKVDELMALCDQLEAQLTTTEADSRCLLEAVLHEALAPVLEETA